MARPHGEIVLRASSCPASFTEPNVALPIVAHKTAAAGAVRLKLVESQVEVFGNHSDRLFCPRCVRRRLGFDSGDYYIKLSHAMLVAAARQPQRQTPA